jgi:soluble lytic murein transglycosylase-like protein
MSTLYQALGIGTLICLASTSALAQEQMYYYKTNQGQLFFSDQQEHDGFQEYGRKKHQPARKITTVSYKAKISHPREIDRTIKSAAFIHKVDANLVRAIVKTESNFDPLAVSHKGAMGLMQLMPATAKYLQVRDPFDPQQNIRGGVKYIGKLLKQYRGNVKLALAAYNAGPGAVSRFNGVPPYPETVHYIKKVLRYYQQLNSVS